MNLVNLKNHLSTIFQNHGYASWFGTKTSYNRKREITPREIIIEPFNLKLEPINDCDFDIELTFWVGLRRDIGAKFINIEGDDFSFIQFHLDEVNKIYNSLVESEHILIKQKKDDISLRYYEADGSQTVNTQSFIRFTVLMRIYGL